MVSRLPILTLAALGGAALAVWGAMAYVDSSSPPEANVLATQNGGPLNATSSSPTAQTLLHRAILALERRQSVSARIRYRVDLFGQRPVGSGVYFELRSERGPLFHWSLKVQLGDQTSSLLEVCDSRYLWVYRKLGGGETLSRVDLARVRKALEDSGDIDRIGSIDKWPGLGGLTKLLRGLHATFDFTTAGQTHLAGQPPLAVWTLRGEWKPQKLAKMVPGEGETGKQEKSVSLDELPEHLADRVLLFLGTEDGFPYRIEYRRRGPDPSASSRARQDRPVLTMEFFEVNLNASIDPARFVYHPGDLECPDTTADFLKSLGLEP